MAILVSSGSAFSVAANTKSADQVTGRNQYVGPGRIQLIARTSVTGMNCTLNVAGVALADDQVIPFTGTAGGMSQIDNVVIDQNIAGGRVELFFRNTTGAAVTVDFIVYYTP